VGCVGNPDNFYPDRALIKTFLRRKCLKNNIRIKNVSFYEIKRLAYAKHGIYTSIFVAKVPLDPDLDPPTSRSGSATLLESYESLNNPILG
jgi:hypothetical protein